MEEKREFTGGMDWQEHPMELVAAIEGPQGLRGVTNAGADAVVFHPFTEGFDLDLRELATMVGDAHLYGPRFYVSMEMPVPGPDLLTALRTIDALAAVGVDGIYLRDTGLFSVAVKEFPAVSFFAGPFLGIHNRQSLRWVRDIGARRVVLEPSLDLTHIGIISRSGALPLEIFLHGASCFSFANLCRFKPEDDETPTERPYCSSFCRQSFRVLSRENKVLSESAFVLSMRDKWMLEHLGMLARLGVHAGRVGVAGDDPIYTSAVVGVYRKALDAIYDEANVTSYYEQADLKRLRSVFNREAAGVGRRATRLIPVRHLGNRIGVVERAISVRKRATILLEDALASGDRLLILSSEGQARAEPMARALTVKGGEVEMAQPGDLVEVSLTETVKAGDVVYKTVDSRLVREIKNSMLSQIPRRRVAIKAVLSAGKPLTVTVVAGNIEVTEEGSSRLERASGIGASTEQVARLLSNMKGTPFRAESLHIDIKEPVEVPAEEIPVVKSRALSVLQKRLRLMGRHKPKGNLSAPMGIPAVISSAPASLLVKVTSGEQALAAMNAGARLIYFPLDSKELAKVRLKAVHKGIRLIAYTEPVLDDRELIDKKRDCKKWQITTILAGNFGMARWAVRHADMGVHLDYTAGVYNAQAYHYWRLEGMSMQTLATGLTFPALKDMPAPDTAVFVHGKLLVAFSRQPLPLPEMEKSFYLESRTGRRFQVGRAGAEIFTIHTAQPVGLFEEAFRLKKMGFQNFRLDFLDESPDKVASIIEIYQGILSSRRQPRTEERSGYIRDLYGGG